MDTAWGMMCSYTPLSETGTICGKLIFRPSLIKLCVTMQRYKSQTGVSIILDIIGQRHYANRTDGVPNIPKAGAGYLGNSGATRRLLELDREVADLGADEVVDAVAASVAVDGGLGTAVKTAAVYNQQTVLQGGRGRNLHVAVDVLVQPELVVGGAVLLDGEGVDGRVAVAAGVGAVAGEGGGVGGGAVGALDLEGDGLQALVVADGEVGDLDGGGGGGEAGEESGGGEDLHFGGLVVVGWFGERETLFGFGDGDAGDDGW